MRFFTSIILLFLFQLSFSQTLEQEIRSRFTNPRKVDFLKYYKGRIDHFNDIALVLAHDGQKCKGQLTYLRSKTIFNLEGTIMNQQFLLNELDELGNVTGSLNGEIKGNSIEAEWENLNNSIGKKAILTETTKLEDFPVHCGDNKWVSIYVGKGNGLELELIVQKRSNNQLSGIAYLEGKSYQFQGDIDERNFINVYLKTHIERNYGKLTGDFKNQNFFRANLIAENGQSRTLTFKLKERLRVGCIEYADYVSSFDLTYPKTKSAQFNNWLGKIVNDWAQSCRNYSKKVSFSKNSQLRASVRAFGWCSMDVYSNELISGFLSFNSTWGKNDRGIAFNFDPKTEQLLTHDDIFKPHFNQNHFIKNLVKTIYTNHPLWGDEGFRSWIEEDAAFPHFIIRKDGINFSTNFNVLYGRQNVTIPFEELGAFLKEHEILKKLTK